MPSWQPLSLITSAVVARPAGLWTLVADFIEGPALLRITADPQDSWSYSDIQTATCGPDGDPRALIATTRCLVPSAPVGALVGKIGGSSAASNDAKPFAVGHNCVVRVPDDGGPLYLSINDEPAGMDNNAQTIEVRVSIAAVEQPAHARATESAPADMR
jgi:hypothetical protein